MMDSDFKNFQVRKENSVYTQGNAHRVKHQTLWKGGQQWKYF